jgi:hypothetical protein
LLKVQEPLTFWLQASLSPPLCGALEVVALRASEFVQAFVESVAPKRILAGDGQVAVGASRGLQQFSGQQALVCLVQYALQGASVGEQQQWLDCGMKVASMRKRSTLKLLPQRWEKQLARRKAQ